MVLIKKKQSLKNQTAKSQNSYNFFSRGYYDNFPEERKNLVQTTWSLILLVHSEVDVSVDGSTIVIAHGEINVNL